MDNSHDVDAYRILTYRSRKRIVRFLVDNAVFEQLPVIEEMLMRAAAANLPLEWPEDILITKSHDSSVGSRKHTHIILPDWFFEHVQEAKKSPYLFCRDFCAQD